MNKVIKKAIECMEKGYERCLPDLEVGEIVKFDAVWDGEEESPLDVGAYSYQVADTIFLNYIFEVVDKREQEQDTLVKIINIELSFQIKVNFPKNKENFKTGNGEGMWVSIDEETKRKYDADEKGTVCKGILDNYSIYYPELGVGDEVIFELRGNKRPVAFIDGFLEKYRNIWDKGEER
ncbi:MAG TPA: hypothetical protein IAC14_07925 [Candidatus Scybalomonas excrementigallinarum]|nr:hypothetical protein [Candidatus Scybalomonas excrementigallinarum]